MSKTIKYGVYPNPLPDADGNITYQVRTEPYYTIDTEAFLSHLRLHNLCNISQMRASLSILIEEIIEQLRDNNRFRIDGLGTFQMKVGLKTKTDEMGNDIKQHYTDPKQITAHDVEVTGISFIPDKTIIRQLRSNIHMEKTSKRGKVGKSEKYTRDEIIHLLDSYLAEHDFITRSTFQNRLGLTRYAAEKWLDRLTTEVTPRYIGCKEGNTVVYRKKTPSPLH